MAGDVELNMPECSVDKEGGNFTTKKRLKLNKVQYCTETAKGIYVCIAAVNFTGLACLQL